MGEYRSSLRHSKVSIVSQRNDTVEKITGARSFGACDFGFCFEMGF